MREKGALGIAVRTEFLPVHEVRRGYGWRLDVHVTCYCSCGYGSLAQRGDIRLRRNFRKRETWPTSVSKNDACIYNRNHTETNLTKDRRRYKGSKMTVITHGFFILRQEALLAASPGSL